VGGFLSHIFHDMVAVKLPHVAIRELAKASIDAAKNPRRDYRLVRRS